MVPVDRRVRLWAWVVRQQGSIGTKTEAEVIAMQARRTPDNGLTNRILGTVVPGTDVRDQVIGGRHYLGDADPADPRVSPLLAADHRGLPPALIQVGEHDPPREDAASYAAALRSAGVPVRFTEYVGMPHGYLNFPGICRGARQALAEICTEQAAALAPRRVP